MKVSLKRLVLAWPTLNSLSQQRILGVTAARIARLRRQARDEVGAFVAARDAIIEKYGLRPQVSGDGQQVVIPFKDNAQKSEVLAEVSKLENDEVEILTSPVTEDEFVLALPDGCQPAWIESLWGWFIVEKGEAATL